MRNFIATCFLLCLVIGSNAQYLCNPQKIVIDFERNRYLVSNFCSSGDLVSISYLGVQEMFINNAGLVDGLQIVEDTIYGSAMGGKIKGYDLNSGELVVTFDLSGIGVQFLSGLVCDSAGFIYTSERFGDRIFKINPKTHQYWLYTEGNGLDQPNGMLYEEDENRILVCLDKANPSIMAIDLADSTVSTVVETTLGGCDGIAKDSIGNYYLTGYYLSWMYKFDPDFSNEPELFYEENSMVYPTYNPLNNTILVTLYNQHSWAEIPIDPDLVKKNEMQSNILLMENFPNPFSDFTNIQFNLSSKAKTKLEVYTMYGEKIKTLLDEVKNSGTYSVKWNGEDSGGQLVSYGVYCLKLTVNGITKSKIIVFLD